VSFYRNGKFVDFCRGPHVPSTGRVKAVKVTTLAGAYWLGDEKNPQLQRIYGTAFFSKKDLDEHHAALHTVDPATGLSYRALLAELMAIEAEEPGPIDLAALRPALGGLGPAAVVALEDDIAAVASYWLPARYEDSPLAGLEQFDTDAGALGLFGNAFDGFAAAEAGRDAVCARTPAALRVESEIESKKWLAAHASSLRQLDGPDRERLVRWLPLFRTDEGEKRIVPHQRGVLA